MERPVLVIGATGQLGRAVLKQLQQSGKGIVAFSRSGGHFGVPASEKFRIAKGDLADADSVDRACQGVSTVIATASSIVPRKGDRFGVEDVTYYENILRACQRNAVEHLVYISAFPSEHDEEVPEFRIKRQIERLIVDSGVPYTIFRCAAFMDIYYAVMGSRMVTTGVEQPTLLRGYWLARAYARWTSGLIEERGVALVPGSGRTRQAFISINDVAAFMVRAVDLPAARDRMIDLGGPEGVSWAEVADVYAEVLGRKVRKVPLPLGLLKATKALLGVFSPAGANIMAILALLGEEAFVPDMEPLCREFGLRMLDTRDFLASLESSPEQFKRRG